MDNIKCMKCNQDIEPLLCTIRDADREYHYCVQCLTELCENDELVVKNDPNLVDEITGNHGAIALYWLGDHYRLDADCAKRLITHSLTTTEAFNLATRHSKPQLCNTIDHSTHIPWMVGDYIVIIDGAKAQTKEELLDIMWEQLDMPLAENKNWDAYLDLMRDLSWISERSISIVIHNYTLFLGKDDEYKKHFFEDMQQVVFPFWGKDAAEVFEDETAIKTIQVHCIDDNGCIANITPSSVVAQQIGKDILNGRKIAHGTSMPFLHDDNGELCIAAFLFFYTAEQLKAKTAQRPSVWATADLSTGAIKNRYQNTAQDDTVHSLELEQGFVASETYWRTTYYMLDLVRAQYLQSRRLNVRLYDKYLARVVLATPVDYREYYLQLGWNLSKEGRYVN